MNESIDIDIETIKAEALRKIGRNISNLAKIEAGLKYLLSISSFEGPAETISDPQNKAQMLYNERQKTFKNCCE
jgi:hypothetical protein